MGLADFGGSDLSALLKRLISAFHDEVAYGRDDENLVERHFRQRRGQYPDLLLNGLVFVHNEQTLSMHHAKSAHYPHSGFAEVVLLDRNAEPLSHKFKLLVKFFGLHNLFVIQSEFCSAACSAMSLIEACCAGRKAVADGSDYNLSHVVNQDMRQSSC